MEPPDGDQDIHSSEPVFLDGLLGEKSIPEIEKKPKYVIEFAMSPCPIKCSFLTRNRLFIPCRQLPYSLTNRDALPPQTSYDVHKSEIFNSFIHCRIDVSKNQFHSGIDFSEVMDFVESMPEVLKSLKTRAQADLYRAGSV